MPEAEPLTYTITPGPEVLAKMGTSFTLFTNPPVLFMFGPDGEPPEPATLTLTTARADDLASVGYHVAIASFTIPEPVNDVQVSPGLEGVEPEPALAPGFAVKASHMEEGDVRVLDDVELHEGSSVAEPGKRRKT